MIMSVLVVSLRSDRHEFFLQRQVHQALRGRQSCDLPDTDFERAKCDAGKPSSLFHIHTAKHESRCRHRIVIMFRHHLRMLSLSPATFLYTPSHLLK